MMKAAATEIAKIQRDATVFVDVNDIVVTFKAVPPQPVRDGLKARGFRFSNGKWTYRPREADEANRAALRGDAAAEERMEKAEQLLNELATDVARELAAAGLRVVRLGAVEHDGVEYEVL